MEEAAKQLALLPFWTALSAAERDMAGARGFSAPLRPRAADL